MKFVVLAAVVGVVLWLMFGRRSGRGRGSAPPDGSGRAPPATPTAIEGMVRCARCGVHLPAGDSLSGPGGQAYCSAAHRDQGPRDA